MNGEELRLWRTERGLTQRELAELLAVDKRTVERWEHGERRIPRVLVPWTLAHYDCTVSTLTRAP